MFCAVCGSVVPLADLIEEHLGSNDVRQRVQEMGEQVTLALDNESRELILMGHALAITAEAGQLFRTYSNSDYGIDAEIEFKDEYGRASGQRLYLVLKAGGLLRRKGRELFKISNRRLADYWRKQRFPVMLVIRTEEDGVRWMDISAQLNADVATTAQPPTHIVFRGEPLTAASIWEFRRRLVGR